MDKIKKSELLELIEEQAEYINDLSKVIKRNELSIIKLEKELEQLKPKKLNRNVFEGQTDDKKFFAVDEDGHGWFYRERPSICEVGKMWAEPNYGSTLAIFDCDASNWRDSLIEREPELTGSDLCRAMLLRFNNPVMCKTPNGFDLIKSYRKDGDKHLFHGEQQGEYSIVTPVNTQGEPLTASDVGI